MRWVLVDKILECEPGKTLVAEKAFSGQEDFFADHFPGYPIVPGVLQIEMIAHAGGRCVGLLHPDRLAILGAVKSAKFYRPLLPPKTCVIRSEITQIRADYALGHGEIEADGERTCVAELMFALIPRQTVSNAWEEPIMADWRRRQAEQGK